MYAFVVKNDEGTWDIWNTLNKIPDPEREERLANAIQSGLPITGMVLTPYKGTAKSGAVWDGTKFTGGLAKAHKQEPDWSVVTQYGYICDNVILVIWYSQPGTENDEQIKAIFDSETTIIKLPEDQTAKIGDIWDGKKVFSV